MELKGNGFTIRQWRDSDAEWLASAANNINVWNNLRDGFPHPYTIDDARAYIESTKHTLYQQAFAIEADGRAVGNIGITPGCDVERLSAEIGYFITEEYWGQGIVSAAVRLVIEEFIFRHTDIVRIFTAIFDYNKASARVLEKAGFRHIGVFCKAAVKNGVIIDEIAYEKVKE